jgi:mutator protein MutT
MSSHAETRSAIFPFLLKTDEKATKILLSRRQNTGYEDGKWDIAGGGHVDEGESAASAVIRECGEELGIDVKIEDVSFIHLSHRFSNRAYYDIYFIVMKYNGSPMIMEPDKCSELKWFDIDNLPEDIIECRKLVIQEYKNKNYYSERIEI